ncbi:hypothetical protein OAG24_00080 [bacterium]|nr:hypothetical protein [bacterium]
MEQTYNFTKADLEKIILKAVKETVKQAVKEAVDNFEAGPKKAIQSKPKKSPLELIVQRFSKLKGDEKRYLKLDGGKTNYYDYETGKGGTIIKNPDPLLKDNDVEYIFYDIPDTKVSICGKKNGIIGKVLKQLGYEHLKPTIFGNKKTDKKPLASKKSTLKIKPKTPPPLETEFDTEYGLNLTTLSGISYIVDGRSKAIIGFLKQEDDDVEICILNDKLEKSLKSQSVAHEKCDEAKLNDIVDKERENQKWDDGESKTADSFESNQTTEAESNFSDEDGENEPEDGGETEEGNFDSKPEDGGETEESNFDSEPENEPEDGGETEESNFDSDDDLIDSASESISKTTESITQAEFENFYTAIKIQKIKITNSNELSKVSKLDKNKVSEIVGDFENIKEMYKDSVKIIDEKSKAQNTRNQNSGQRGRGCGKRGRGRGKK